MSEKILAEGERLFAEGDFEKARHRFLDLLKENPDDKKVLNNLGVIDFQENHLNQSSRWFTRALKADPFYTVALLNYSDLLRVTNHREQAHELLEIAAKRHPEDSTIHSRLKQCLEELQHNEIKPPPQKLTLKRPKEDILANKKILHAPFEIAGNMGRIASNMQNHGFSATSANYYDSWENYQCDINLKVLSIKPSQREKAIKEFARKAMNEYDIFHFHYAHSLHGPYLTDLPILKNKGKKIFFSFWGSDCHSIEWTLYQQMRYLGYRPPRPYSMNRQIYESLKKINLYADVLFGMDNLPRGIKMRGHVNTSAWPLVDRELIRQGNLHERKPDKTYFVHTTSNDWKKGSHLITSALKECQDEGMPIEIISVNNMQSLQTRELYAQADFAIDQIGIGTYSSFGIEMMCWQIPVLVWHTDLFDQLRNNPPVIHITKKNFKKQIKNCIRLKKTGELVKLGETSRKFAIENEDINLRVPVYLQCYRDALAGKQILQNVNRAWYQEEEQMLSGVKSEFYRYLIDHNLHKRLQVVLPDYDKDLYY